MSEKLSSYIDIEHRDGVDLNMYQCGIEECHSSHGVGPGLRDHYLIHYILEGSGTFSMDDKKYKLSKGQGFLIPPNVITHYAADEDTPWTYIWVGFHGLKADAYLQRANLTRQKPVFDYQGEDLQNYIFKMMDVDIFSNYRDLKLQGYLFLFISELIKNSPKHSISAKSITDIYIHEAITFIENNYSRPIKISDIAVNLSLDRSYFSNIFKKTLQKTPQQFLLDYRMNKACELLINPELSISNIAFSVGYTDAFNFSKMFKRIKGSSPSDYRKTIK